MQRKQSRGRLFVGEGNKEEAKTMSRPGSAALLSFLIPGVGQIYNGDILRGVFWLIITPGFWIGTGGLLGWVCHIIAAATAHSRAEDKERGRLPAY